jgi:hypothetical protein
MAMKALGQSQLILSAAVGYQSHDCFAGIDKLRFRMAISRMESSAVKLHTWGTTAC